MKVKCSYTLDRDVHAQLQKLRRRQGAKSESQFLNFILRKILFNELQLARIKARDLNRQFQQALTEVENLKDLEDTKPPIEAVLPPIKPF